MFRQGCVIVFAFFGVCVVTLIPHFNGGNPALAQCPACQVWFDPGYASTVIAPQRNWNVSVAAFIRTYRGDAHWLTFCLRSLRRYAEHVFSEVVVVFPTNDSIFFSTFLHGYELPLKVFAEEEVVSHGYEQQMLSKMFADTRTMADFIWHVDSDTILKRQLRYEDLFDGGKPVYFFDKWSGDSERIWRPITEDMLGRTVEFDFMRRQGLLYPRCIYEQTRKHLERVKGVDFVQYWKTHQFHVTEYNVLGGYMYYYHRSEISWQLGGDPKFPNPLIQSWSWGGFHHVIITWYDCIIREGEAKCPLHPRFKIECKSG